MVGGGVFNALKEKNILTKSIEQNVKYDLFRGGECLPKGRGKEKKIHSTGVCVGSKTKVYISSIVFFLIFLDVWLESQRAGEEETK